MNSVLARRHDARTQPTPRQPTAPDTAAHEENDHSVANTPAKDLDPDDKPPVSVTPRDPVVSGSLSKKKPPNRSPRGRWPQALFCAAAIMVSLMGYSILQERIMTRPYLSASVDMLSKTSNRRPPRVPPPAAFFKNSLFLVLANRLFAAAVAAAIILFKGDRDEFRSKAPLIDYVSISLSNVIATSCQYEALKWLTFPTVTIGKCAKMLPVMLILNFKSGRQYSYEDFGIVGVVLAGCAVMISAGNVTAKRTGAADEDTPLGFALLVIYLLFDAIVSTYQERLFDKYDMTVYNQMLYINVSSVTLSILGLTMSGGLFDSLRFIRMYPRIAPDISMLSLSAVAGQFAITYTIQSFGALLYAGIMTTRQFCSVLASDIIFEHGLTLLQWSGALMVFSALFYKLWRKAVQSIE